MREPVAHDSAPRVLGAAAYTFGGSLFQIAISLVSGIVVARVLGPAAYGVFSLARTWCETATLVTKGGYDVGIVRYLGERPVDARRGALRPVLHRVLVVVALISLVPAVGLFMGGADWLENTLYGHAGFAATLLGLALAIPFMSLTQVLGGMFRGALHFLPRVAVELVMQPALRFATILLLFVYGMTLDAVIVATVASFAVAALVLYALARGSFLRAGPANPVAASGWSETRAISRYASTLALTMIVTAVMQRADLLVLGHYVDAAEVGRYALAQMIVALLTVFNGALNQGIAPALADLHRRDERDAMRRLIHRHSRWVSIATFPLFCLMLLFGNQVLSAIGPDYVVEWRVLALLACAQLASALLSSSGFMLSMTGHHRRELGVMVLGALLAVALSLILISSAGAVGAAASGLIAVVATNALRAWRVYRVFGIAPVGRDALVPLAVGAPVAALVATALDGGAITLLEAVLWAAGFGLAYVAVVFRFALHDDDRQVVARLVRRWGA